MLLWFKVRQGPELVYEGQSGKTQREDHGRAGSHHLALMLCFVDDSTQGDRVEQLCSSQARTLEMLIPQQCPHHREIQAAKKVLLSCRPAAPW